MLVAACAATKPAPALDPRYVTLHNAFAAMGLAEVGPIRRGSLAEGREARFPLELGADCSMVVAIGAGNETLDVSILDSEDKLVTKGTAPDNEAATKVCPGKAGKFTAVVKMMRGAGDFTIATWTGMANGSSGPGTTAVAQEGEGTCESPFVLLPGQASGNTRRGVAMNASKNCGASDAKELVYRLDVTKPQRLTIDIDPSFDSIVYVRRDDCNEPEAEIACNDDAAPGQAKASNGTHASHIEEMVEQGTYYVFVDGYQDQGGWFRMTTELADVPSLAEECKTAQPLASQTQGTLGHGFDVVEGGCGSGVGPEVPYTLAIPTRARARVVMHAEDFGPVVHLRKTCTDESTEQGCTDEGANARKEAALVSVLGPGSYTVFADSNDKTARGKFTMSVDLTPESGKGVRGDACGDAIAITPNDKAVEGDTFDAKDDFQGTCTAAGAPDTMYRFELTAKSKVTARFDSEEGAHAFQLLKNCTDRASEVACNHQLEEVLPAGTYWLAVDGTQKGPFGKYAFQLRAKDVSAQEAACKAAPALALGQTVTGTTAGAGDRFTVSCGGRFDAQQSGDRVFRLALPTRQHVQLNLTTPNHDGVLAVRRACQDPPQMKSVRDMEAACNNDSGNTQHSKIDTTLDAGTYYVVVDGHQGKNEGTFTLEAKALK